MFNREAPSDSEYSMADTHPSIPVLDLAGTPAQIGAAHGESQRDRIRDHTDRFLGWLLSTAAVRLTEQQLWDRWAPQVAVNRREAPDLVEEMHGISRGAAVPRQLVFTFAGIVGAAGLNEAGIALNINYLSPLDVGPGRLHSVVVRQVLASAQLADALTHPVLPPRAGGAHFLVADRDGNVVSVETTARRFVVAHPEGAAIGHTNHYLAPELRDTEYLRAGSIGGSLARYTALRRFLRERGDRLTVDALKELTRNHTS